MCRFVTTLPQGGMGAGHVYPSGSAPRFAGRLTRAAFAARTMGPALLLFVKGLLLLRRQLGIELLECRDMTVHGFLMLFLQFQHLVGPFRCLQAAQIGW